MRDRLREYFPVTDILHHRGLASLGRIISRRPIGIEEVRLKAALTRRGCAEHHGGAANALRPRVSQRGREALFLEFPMFGPASGLRVHGCGGKLHSPFPTDEGAVGIGVSGQRSEGGLQTSEEYWKPVCLRVAGRRGTSSGC